MSFGARIDARTRLEAIVRAARAAEEAGVARWDALVGIAEQAEAVASTVPGLSCHVRAVGRLLSTARIAMVDAVIGWDAEVGWAYDGAPSPQSWLTAHLGMSKGEAHQLVAVARLCRTVPEALAALHGELGDDRLELSFEQLLIWARVVTTKRAALFASHAAEVLPCCAGLSLPDSTTVAERWARYADDLLDLGRPDDRYERRGWRMHDNPDGTVTGDFCFDPHGRSLLHAYLDANDRPDPDDYPGGPRTRAQRHADLMIELVERAVNGSLDAHPIKPARATHHALALVHVGDPSGLAETPDGAVLDRGLTELYACTALVSRVRLDATGEVLDLGRAARLFTAAQTKASIARDRHCQFPGCDRPPSWCDVHHVRHWERGGTTDLANGVLICHQHHRLLHHRGWALRRHADSHGWQIDRHPARHGPASHQAGPPPDPDRHRTRRNSIPPWRRARPPGRLGADGVQHLVTEIDTPAA